MPIALLIQMVMFFMQSTPEIAANALENASQKSGEIWIASLVIIGGMVLIYVYWKLIAGPNEASNREAAKSNQEVLSKLAEAISSSGRIAAETHVRTESIYAEILKHKQSQKNLLACREYEVVALQKMSEALDVDIQTELAKIEVLINASHSDEY